MDRQDIIIIGAGPAGLSAAIYGSRAGKRVLVLEGRSYGGQIINTPRIENYPGIREISGYAFATDLYEQVKALGVEIRYERVTGIARQEAERSFSVATEKQEYRCQSVILAVGAGNRKLGIAREQELVGSGVSYCATCDGMFYRDKEVAVVGGGNTALEDALFLSNYCRRVFLIHRRDAFRGENQRVQLLQNRENVVLCLEETVSSIVGTDRVQGVVLRHSKTGQERELAVEGLFIAVGQEPNTQCFKDWVEMDSNGYVEAGEDCQTSIPGVFAAGDCRRKQVRQLTTAVADGSVAALAACEVCEAAQ